MPPTFLIPVPKTSEVGLMEVAASGVAALRSQRGLESMVRFLLWLFRHCQNRSAKRDADRPEPGAGRRCRFEPENMSSDSDKLPPDSGNFHEPAYITPIDSRRKVASLAGLEPTHLAPEASALSN
jgi:hypothetical protein